MSDSSDDKEARPVRESQEHRSIQKSLLFDVPPVDPFRDRLTIVQTPPPETPINTPAPVEPAPPVPTESRPVESPPTE